MLPKLTRRTWCVEVAFDDGGSVGRCPGSVSRKEVKMQKRLVRKTARCRQCYEENLVCRGGLTPVVALAVVRDPLAGRT